MAESCCSERTLKIDYAAPGHVGFYANNSLGARRQFAHNSRVTILWLARAGEPALGTSQGPAPVRKRLTLSALARDKHSHRFAGAQDTTC